ncbi:nucleolar complex protein 2 homolog [Dysidea avara]|uniref:nucleolar complex protein 2 homolog n=1 Tax=Dysidea avara TaxID=196820 RepID=UPI00332EE970
MAARGKRKRRRLTVDELLASDLTQSDDDDDVITGDVTTEDVPHVKKRKHDNSPSTAATHKSDLANLAQSDPEFYQFLLSEDRELLEFNEDDVSDDLNQSDEAEDLNQSDDEATTLVTKKGIVTQQMVKKWEKSITKDGVSSHHISDIIEALHSGVCHYLSSAHDPDETNALSYTLNDGQVFNSLLSTSLRLLPSHLPTSHTSHRNKAWKKLKPTIKIFITDLLKLLEQLTDASLLCAVLRAVRSLVACYVAMGKLLKQLIKVLVKLWTGDDDLVRIGAFLCLRQVIQHSPQSLEPVVKQLYLSLVSSARFSGPEKMKLLQTSLVELIRMDVSTGYQMGFVYIRQLAISLRNAHTSGQSKAWQPVLSWQFLRCLQLWAQLVSEEQSLEPLVYPLVQICLSCVMLQTKANYFPLRLHIIRLLLPLAKSHDYYVPLATLLLEVMEYKYPTKSLTTGKPVAMETTIRLSKQLLHNRAVQSRLLDTSYELLLEYLCDLSHTIAFPELVVPIVLRLNKVAKTTKVSWLNRQLKQLVTKLDNTSDQLVQDRSKLSFGPGDLKQVQQWESGRKKKDNPLKQFLLSWRQMKELEKSDSKEEISEGDSDT